MYTTQIKHNKIDNISKATLSSLILINNIANVNIIYYSLANWFSQNAFIDFCQSLVFVANLWFAMEEQMF